MISTLCFLLVIISGRDFLWSFSMYQVQALALPDPRSFDRSRTRTHSNMAAAINDEKKPSITYRPILKDTDQEIVWRVLMNAAHETDLAEVKENSLLQPYAQYFGNKEGDIGVAAIDENAADNFEDNANPKVAGAAWVRLLREKGFAASVLDDPTRVHNMPELAIACLPEYRGQGIGSNLLRKLLRAVKEQNSSKYDGVCLSCREGNPAMKLYERLGFTVLQGSKTTNRTGGSSLTMVHVFQNSEK